VVKKFTQTTGSSSNWTILLEPSIWTDSAGTIHALFREDWKVWAADSSDGLIWSNIRKVIDPSTDPDNFGGVAVHNPGAVYDPVAQVLRGIMYGEEPTTSPGNAKINISYTQYKAFGHTGATTHGNGYALNKDDFLLGIGSFTTYDRLQVTNPVTQTTLVDLSGLSGNAGDVWQFNP